MTDKTTQEKKAEPQTEDAAPSKTLTRIQPTKEGADILKQLAAKGEEVIKSASKTGETYVSKKSIEWLTTAVKDIPGASMKTVDEKGYRHALVIKKKNGKEDVWYVQRAGARMGFFGMWLGSEFTLINKNDPQMIVIFNRAPKDAKKDSEQVLDALREARRDTKSQKNDPAGVKAFDLTKKRPIGYLCFNGFDESDRSTRTQYFEYSNALPELLKNCGYDMVCLDNKNRIEELKAHLAPGAVAGLAANPTLGGLAAFAANHVETPAKLVERRIDALYKQGVRDFYLNFLTHGDRKKGLMGVDGIWLNGEEMKKMLLKYKDCTFAIDATGCEGGGLIGMMRDFKDVPDAPEGRIGVFVHTKEDRSILSHDYQTLLIKGLMDMADGKEGAPKTYGEAHHRADRETKRTTNGQYDPEFWKSRPGKKSRRTAKNDPTPNPLAEIARQYFTGHTPAYDSLEPQHNLSGLVKQSEQKFRS